MRDFETRNDGQGDKVRAGFMEARLLWEHAMDRDAARMRMQALLAHREHALHAEMLRFARTL